MERFTDRGATVDGKQVYDYDMPKNADTYGNSHVVDEAGVTHTQITHSKVRIWPADDPSKSAHVTIVSGNGQFSVDLDIGASLEWAVDAPGLVSVVSDDKRPLNVYADVFPVWAG